MKTSLFRLVLLLTLPVGLQAQDDLTKQVTRDWLNSGGGVTANSNSGILSIIGCPHGRQNTRTRGLPEGDKAPELEAYLKATKPDLKNRDDLKAAFQYYNSL